MALNVSADTAINKFSSYGMAGYIALGLLALWLFRKLFFFMKGRRGRKGGKFLGLF